jgi:sugar phosphate permease
MISSPLAAALARRNIHYGWIVVGVTFLTMLATAGAMGAPGVLIVPLEREFGWDNAQISSALALRLLLFGLFGPFAAAFMNRFGLRRVVVCAAVLIAGGLLTSLAMTQVWQLVVLWGLVVGIGTGLTAIVLAVTVATRWFTARRGLVVGLLSASSATGQLVFLPLIASLTDHLGWRLALVFVCGLLGLAALLAFALMRDRPSDLNLPPYGEREIVPAPPAGVGLISLLSAPIEALRDAARVPLRGLSLLFLPFTTFTFYGLSLFAVFYGLDWIATVPPTVKLTADRFGRERAGIVFGWVFAGHQIGAATAALGAGFSRTEFASYLPAFFAAGALCMIAAALVLTIAKPKAAGLAAAPAPARG